MTRKIISVGSVGESTLSAAFQIVIKLQTNARKWMGPMNRVVLSSLLVILFVLTLPSFAAAQSPRFRLSSSAFAPAGPIPPQYTCRGGDGESNVSPPLQWHGAPAATKTFALIIEDPDAPSGTFVHWVIFNIPASTDTLSAGQPLSPRLVNGALQGVNGRNKIGYTGPCPPAGPAHHYHFDLIALDSALPLASGATAIDVKAASVGRVIGSAELIGTFAR